MHHGNAKLLLYINSIIIIMDIEFTPGCMCLYIIRVQAQAEC